MGAWFKKEHRVFFITSTIGFKENIWFGISVSFYIGPAYYLMTEIYKHGNKIRGTECKSTSHHYGPSPFINIGTSYNINSLLSAGLNLNCHCPNYKPFEVINFINLLPSIGLHF